jgi:hypothetical protein
MKLISVIVLATFLCNFSFADENKMVSEVVYVESTTDTDSDGKLDRIYVSIKRPSSNKKLSTKF